MWKRGLTNGLADTNLKVVLGRTNKADSPARRGHSRKGGNRMPLTMAKAGECNAIKHVGGREDTRRFLENLGFVVGSDVTLISQIGGNVIVHVKESRVAISREMANKIMI